MPFMSTNLCAWDRVDKGSTTVAIACPVEVLDIQAIQSHAEGSEVYDVAIGGLPATGDGTVLQITSALGMVGETPDVLARRNWAPHGWSMFATGSLKMKAVGYSPTPGLVTDVGTLVYPDPNPFTDVPWELAELGETGDTEPWPDFTCAKNERPKWIIGALTPVQSTPVIEYPRKGYGVAPFYPAFQDTVSGDIMAFRMVVELTFKVRVMTPFIYKSEGLNYMALDVIIEAQTLIATGSEPPFTAIDPFVWSIFEGSSYTFATAGATTVYDPETAIPVGSVMVRDSAVDPVDEWGTSNLASGIGSSVGDFTADVTLECNQHYTGEPGTPPP